MAAGWRADRSDLDFVLKGVSVRFAPREKIGVVGRTGSGKVRGYLAVARAIRCSVLNAFTCLTRRRAP
jgi:ABC-type multidrug transport system fused ATPase/permease subunit